MAVLVDTTIRDDITFSSVEGNIELIDSTGGSTFVLKDSVNAKDRLKIGPDGLVLEPLAADPASPVDGGLWYNSTENLFKFREGGVIKTLGAPTDASYIVQQANAALTNAQALADLSSGILKNTTGTGVLSIAVKGTDYYGPGGPDVAIADGGTGASTASAARANLGAASSGTNSDITSLTGLTSDSTTKGSWILDAAAPAEDSYSNSPFITLRGRYDSLAGTGITDTSYDFKLQTIMESTSPTAHLSIQNNAGTELVVVDEAGNVGIGTTSPGEKLHVVGGKVLIDEVSGGSGQTSAAALGAMHIIGTSNPSYIYLTPYVAGALQSSYSTFIGATYANNSMRIGVGTPGGTLYTLIESDGHNTPETLKFLTYDIGSGSSVERMRIQGGNVGIGTTTPKQRLHNTGHYYGLGSIWLHAFEGDGASGTAYLQARDDSGTTDIELQLRTQNAGTIVDALRIDNTGNVGIGTTSPGAKLHVAEGDILITSTSGQRGLLVDVDDNANAYIVLNSGLTTVKESKVYLKDRGSARWSFGKNVGNNFEIKDDANNLPKLVFLPGSTGNAYFNNVGNVGIGTTEPGYKLDVAGKIRGEKYTVTFPFSYSQGALTSYADEITPLYLGQWADAFQFGSIESVEYWDGTSWVTWSSPPNFGKLFDGRPDTSVTIDDTHKKFRIVLKTGKWLQMGIIQVQREWQEGGPFEYTLTVETSPDQTTWTQRGSATFSASNYFDHLQVDVHNSDIYWRFTFDNVLAAGETQKFMWVRGFTARVTRGTYGGLPLSWDYDQNIGIGTTSPEAKLQITSSSEPYLLLKGGTSTKDLPELRLEQTTAGLGDAPKITFLNPDVSTTDLSALSMRDGTAFTFEYPVAVELMRIDTSGNVGIGTTSPEEKLHVNGTTRIDVTGATNYLSLVRDGATKANIKSEGAFMIDLAPQGAGGKGYIRLAGTSASEKFIIRDSANKDFMAITGAGDVGIGTTAPAGKLHLYSSSGSVISIIDAPWGYNAVTDYCKGGTTVVWTGLKGNQDTRWSVGNSGLTNEWLTVTTSGNVGIGTTTPKQRLHNTGDYYGKGHIWLHAYEGDGASGTAYLQARDDSGTTDIELQLRTQNAGTLVEALRIDNTGNVGIGTTSPLTSLQVGATNDGKDRMIRVSAGDNKFASIKLVETTSTTEFGFQWAHDGLNNRLDLLYGSQAASGGGENLPNVAMSILRASGNVGIGTASPEERLDIAGNIIIRDTGTIRGIRRDNDAYNLNLAGGSALNQGAYISLSGDDRGGSGNPYNGRIELFSGGISAASQSDVPGDYYFNTQWNGGKATLMFIDSSTGNVGIGTTDPIDKLDVDGTIVANFKDPAIAFMGDIDGARWIVSLGNYDLTFKSDNADTTSLGTGDTTYQTRTFRPKVQFTQTGNLHVAGNVGIGTTNPGYKLDVSGAGRFTNPLFLTGNMDQLKFEPTGTNRYWFMSKPTDNKAFGWYSPDETGWFMWIPTGTGGLIINTGNVGIGTEEPEFNLDIRKTGSKVLRLGNNTGDSLSFDIAAGAGLVNLVAGAEWDGTQYLFTGTRGAARLKLHDGSLQLQTSTATSGTAGSAVSWNTGLYIDNNGNVGIGTEEPEFKLDIRKTGSKVLRLGNNAGNDLSFDIAAGTGLVNLVAGAEWDGTQYLFTGTRGAARLKLHDGSLQLQTSTATSGTAGSAVSWNTGLYINNNGNVGIGTTTPGAPLEVQYNGTAQAAVIIIDQNNATKKWTGLNLQRQGSEKWFLGMSDADDKLRFRRTASSDDMVIDTTGNVGIGTTEPTERLHIVGSGDAIPMRIEVEGGVEGKPGIELQDPTAANYGARLYFDDTLSGLQLVTLSNSIEKQGIFVARDTGNVGIGTTNPSSFKLQIAGALGPDADNSYNCGSSTLRWANGYFVNITTGDLNLRSEDGKADWIIREAEDGIKVINKRTGKTYRLVMEEIDECLN